jgi:hypothetical protein
MTFGVRAAFIAIALLTGCVRPETVPSDRAALPDALPEISEPSAENPVTAAAWMTPGDVSSGEPAEVRVRVRIAPAHHLYAPGVPADAPGIPVSLVLKPLDALEPVGEWTFPETDGNKHLTGVVEFRRAVRVRQGTAAGAHQVACELRYQACTSELCWPPRTLTLSVALNVRAKP